MRGVAGTEALLVRSCPLRDWQLRARLGLICRACIWGPHCRALRHISLLRLARAAPPLAPSCHPHPAANPNPRKHEVRWAETSRLPGLRQPSRISASGSAQYRSRQRRPPRHRPRSRRRRPSLLPSRRSRRNLTPNSPPVASCSNLTWHCHRVPPRACLGAAETRSRTVWVCGMRGRTCRRWNGEKPVPARLTVSTSLWIPHLLRARIENGNG